MHPQTHDPVSVSSIIMDPNQHHHQQHHSHHYHHHAPPPPPPQGYYYPPTSSGGVYYQYAGSYTQANPHTGYMAVMQPGPGQTTGMPPSSSPSPVVWQDYGCKPAPPPPVTPVATPQAAPKQPQEIVLPHDNDVLMGRGGKNNQHVGNEKLRDMARAVREEYKKSSKKGKSNMSRDLVQQVRDMDPPGRFLKRNPVTSEWEDVGDEIAREKVSQVLRDAVSEYCGPKAEKAANKSRNSENGQDNDDDDDDDDDDDGSGSDNEENENDDHNENEPKNNKEKTAEPENATEKNGHSTEDKPRLSPVPSRLANDSSSVEPDTLTPDMAEASFNNSDVSSVSLSEPAALDRASTGGESFDSHSMVEPAVPKRVTRVITGNSDVLPVEDELAPISAEQSQDPVAEEPTLQPEPQSPLQGFRSKTQRTFNAVPVQAVPWKRINKRKTNLLDRYSNMGTSTSDMSISSIGSQQLSSRNLGATQLSSRQLMSTGARQISNRQLSSRQLSSRQLSNRQLSSRQLSSRQLSGRNMMSLERRTQNFAMMGESDLSLDALSISGHSSIMFNNKPRSRKNIYMEQYRDMDMGLSDFSLGSVTGVDFGEGSTAAGRGHQRPSVIIEGDLEELSDHSSANLTFHQSPQELMMEHYAATGIGTSISNMTMNTIGTFSGHSRRGLFTMNSMRMESTHSFLTIDELQLDMLDDELFDEYAEYNHGNEQEFMEDDDDDEFCSEFC